MFVMKINIKKRYGILIFLVLIITVVIVLSSPSPPPNPGHPASEIGSGTFSGDVNDIWSFPGKVGIGTASPTERLDVDGYVKGRGGLCIGNDCRSTWPSGGTGYWAASGNDIYNTNTGNVGIGTSNPQAKLDVRGKIYANNPPAVGYGSVVARGAVTAVYGDTNHYGYFEGRRSDNRRGFYLGYGNGNDLVTLWLDSANKLNIGGGKVGIGTTNPTQKLDVNGYVKGRSGLCIGNDCRSSWPSGGGGDITAVYAGNGLTGGGTSGDVTLHVGAGTGISVGSNSVGLKYPSKSCPSGKAIRSFNLGSSSGPVCVDVGGDGLSGSGTTNYIPKWTGSKSLGNSVIYQTGSDIKISGRLGTAGRSPSCPNGWSLSLIHI